MMGEGAREVLLRRNGVAIHAFKVSTRRLHEFCYRLGVNGTRGGVRDTRVRDEFMDLARHCLSRCRAGRLQVEIGVVGLIAGYHGQREGVAPVGPATVVEAHIFKAQVLELHPGQGLAETIVAVDVDGLVTR